MSRRFGKKNHVKVDPLSYNTILLGEPKIGKEQPISEPVLTSAGWKPMGEIQIGDLVYGRDGKTHPVTGVFPQGVKDVYEVTFKDGTSTRCGLKHLWTVQTTKQRSNMRKYNDYRYKVVTLEEILKDYKTSVNNINKKSKFNYKYSVPANLPIEFDNQNKLPLSPYALGLMLGDGGFTGNVCTFTNSENELFEELANEISSLNVMLHTRCFDNHKQASIVCETDKSNPFKEVIKKLGLNNCGSREKFIPEIYIYSSIENRLALLSGIINTDGHIARGNKICISTYSKNLAYDISSLARSLGYIVKITEYDRTDENSTKKYSKEVEYSMSIYGDYEKLHLSTKHKNKLNKERNFEYSKIIRDIKLVGKEESQCIMVDNPDHTYITKDYVVTHNTTLIKEVCEELVGEDGYLFLEMGKESGADAIEGIIAEDVSDWDTFEDIKDDIIENRTTDYKDLKVVVIDTYDGFIELAEAESIRQSNKEYPDAKVKSIDAAWKGYQRGQKKALELMLDALWEFKEVGINFIVIGHVKPKDITDTVSGETYTTLTNDVEKVYFNGLKKKVHFLALAYFDRTISSEKTGKKDFKGNEVIKKTLKSQSRKIKFRDDAYVIDSGSRFAEIVPEIEFDSAEFIKALTDAIKAEQAKSNKSFDETKREQDEEIKKRMKEIEVQQKIHKEENELKENIETIQAFIVKNKTNKEVVAPILLILKKHGVTNLQEITDLNLSKEILKLTK